MEVLLVVVIVLLSATLIVLVTGILLYISQLNKAVSEMSETLKAIRKDVVPLSADAKRVLVNTDNLISGARQQVDSIKRVTDLAEQWLDGRNITRAAGAAVSTSRTKVVSALEGLKIGLKALRSAKTDQKEESLDEE